jgi:hypothetical protein
VQLADSKAAKPPPTLDEIRQYAQKVLACRDFNTSARNRRFLSYVVEETLSGRGARIKAYNIALAAFDRGEDFDPLPIRLYALKQAGSDARSNTII